MAVSHHINILSISNKGNFKILLFNHNNLLLRNPESGLVPFFCCVQSILSLYSNIFNVLISLSEHVQCSHFPIRTCSMFSFPYQNKFSFSLLEHVLNMFNILISLPKHNQCSHFPIRTCSMF